MCQQDSRKHATCDQEAWVKARIRTAIDMAMAIEDIHKIQAENGMKEGAIRGIVNAAAVEVIYTLGLKPEYTNLSDPWGREQED